MSITLRDIKEDDLLLIMQWRMDPDITKYMNTDPVLTPEGQLKWLQSINSDASVMHWLIEDDHTPIGIINLIDIDWENHTSSWGYYIGEKNHRSLKTAISLEMSLYDFVFDVLDFTELHNEVFTANSGVIKLHLACGSHITKEVKNGITKNNISYDITNISITKETWNDIRRNKKYDKINFDVKLTPHHIGLAVADIDNAILKFRKLGYYQSTDIFDDSSRNVKIVFMESYEGTQRLELISPSNENSPVTDTLKKSKNSTTPYHICYETESLEKGIYLLRQRGFIITKMPSPAIAFDNRPVVFLFNKDAGLVELIQK